MSFQGPASESRAVLVFTVHVDVCSCAPVIERCLHLSIYHYLFRTIQVVLVHMQVEAMKFNAGKVSDLEYYSFLPEIKRSFGGLG